MKDKKTVAFLTIRGYSVQLTRVEPKEGGGYNFLNADKLYTQLGNFKSIEFLNGKSVPFYESESLDHQLEKLEVKKK